MDTVETSSRQANCLYKFAIKAGSVASPEIVAGGDIITLSCLRGTGFIESWHDHHVDGTSKLRPSPR